jgi:hypothetical protein
MAIWRMRFACWITEATNTHSEYVYTKFVCLVYLSEMCAKSERVEVWEYL